MIGGHVRARNRVLYLTVDLALPCPKRFSARHVANLDLSLSMGVGGSSAANDGEGDDVIGKEYGFRVHRVENNSPGQDAGLQSILDYVVVANGVRLSHDDGSFVQMITESKGKPMRLLVFDTHTLRTRETVLTPGDSWGGTGLVGITIRFDLAQNLSKHTLHVLDVFENSPASAAGLDAHNDYIIGVGDLLYDGPDEFGEIVHHNEGRPLRLYVYSVQTESVREVVIRPERGWGGDGCLGCSIGAGYLHTLPPRRDLNIVKRSSAPSPPQPPAVPVVMVPHAAAPSAAELVVGLEQSSPQALPAADVPGAGKTAVAAAQRPPQE